MQERRFNEKEVGQILSKAAALQSGISSPPPADGVSLAELQRLAEEVGLDPKCIESAASDVVNARRVVFSDRSNSVRVEQTLSREVTDDCWDDIVACMRTAGGSAGTSESKPGKWEWVGGSDLESLILTATSRNGRTDIKLIGDNQGTTAISVSLGSALILFGTVAFAAVGMTFGAGTFGHLGVLCLTLAFAVLSFGVLIRTIRQRRSQFCKRLEALMGNLVEVVESFGVSEEGLTLPTCEPQIVDSNLRLHLS